jgi:putative spermidine/putrescine transport system ATP-binding protein
MGPAVEFEGVSRHFGPVRAVDGVDLAIGEGSFFAMLGPSGSGKTTCLRLISGFETPSAGHVRIFGDAAEHLPPNRRSVNTVFQDYALFPHLNVRDNVGYGLMVRGVARAARLAQVEEMLALVRLEGFGGRKPGQLSGGQRQRVALARALVNHPRVLLLDEPLGALDLKLREAMQDELKALQVRLGITFVFVTHDQGEALSMADRVAVFNAGRVAQVGTPREIYERPRTRFVADVVGSSNVLPPALAARVGARGWASLRPVALPGYGGRRPGQLSGGQRQRVALARALVMEPRVLLLDEPLGALDLKLREAMQEELKALQRALGITFVFVTHDQGEALSMADRVAVFNAGRIVQTGTPEDIYQRPETRFVADFVGSSNVLPPVLAARFGGPPGWASLRPEAVLLAGAEAPVSGVVVSRRYLGAGTRITVDPGLEAPADERGYRDPAEAPRIDLLLPAGASVPEVGARVGLSCAPDALHPMKAGG